MSGSTVQQLAQALRHRTLRIEVARRDDGAAVWRGSVRSIRHVVWCAEEVELGVLLAALVRWLDSETHRADCRCVLCVEAAALAALDLDDE